MKIWVRGEGAVSLTKRDFLGQGGQGAVYAKGDTAFKIYSDPSCMLADGKLKELSSLTAGNMVRPKKVICDKHGTPLGYTMSWIREAYTLCQLFPRSFRERHGVTEANIADLVEQFRVGLAHIHKAGVLAVDLNEMNMLVGKNFDKLYFIDVDSYQTRSYPADAIMESIRDRHAPANIFSESTDWFSFAVVSFQMFVGMHPFKGKHATLKGLDARMKANVSVLNRDVRVPKAAYPFQRIPAAMLAWYGSVFETGARCPPPTAQGLRIYVPVVRPMAGSSVVCVEELCAFDGAVTGLWDHGGRVVVATERGLWMDGRRVGSGAHLRGVGFSPKTNLAIAISGLGDPLRVSEVLSGVVVPFGSNASVVESHDGRVYLQAAGKILELVLTESGNSVVAGARICATVLPNATDLYSGVAIQDLLGSTFVSVFPRAGVAHQQHVEELDDYRVVDAKFDSGVLMLMARPRSHSQHRFDRIVIRFSHDYQRYDVRVIEDVAQAGLNFVVLDTGVCVSMTEDDRLELFHRDMGTIGTRLVDDDVLGADMTLRKLAGTLGFTRGATLYSMTLQDN